MPEAALWIGAGLLVGSVVALGPALVYVVREGHRERIEPAALGLILGARVRRDGSPTPVLEARLRRGLALYRAGTVRVLMVSGGQSPHAVSEPAAMSAWLKAHGVPEAHLVEDADGLNTYQSARSAARWLAAHPGTGLQGRGAIAVSQRWHLARARLALKRWGVRPVGTAGAGRAPGLGDWKRLLREAVGVGAYALRPYGRP